MIDRTIIQTRGLLLKRELCGATPIAELLPEGYPHKEVFKGSKRSKFTIKLGQSILNKRPIKLVCEGTNGGSAMVTTIQVNFSSLLHGQNGSPLISDNEFHRVAAYFLSLMECLCTPESFHRALPGLGNDNHSYWKLLEVYAQGYDKDFKLGLALQCATHPRARKSYSCGDILNGKKSFKKSMKWVSHNELSVSHYWKSREVNGHLSREGQVTRLEVTAPTSEMEMHFGEEGFIEQKLRAFRFEDLQKMFLSVVSEINGLPGKELVIENKSIAGGLASIAHVFRLPVDLVVDSFYVGAPGKEVTRKKRKKEAAQIFADSIEVDGIKELQGWIAKPESVEFNNAREKAAQANSLLPQTHVGHQSFIERAYSRLQFIPDTEIAMTACRKLSPNK